MNSISIILLVLTTWSAVKGQFFYNYEEEPTPVLFQTEDHDTSYKYSSPEVVEQNYVQNRPANVAVQNNEPSVRQFTAQPELESQPVKPRTRSRTKKVYTSPQYNEEQNLHRAPRRRAQRTRENIQEEQIEFKPPKIYSPSVFENIGLGQAPEGVHVPEDSLLNILRTGTTSNTRIQQNAVIQYAPQENIVSSPPRRRNSEQRDSYFFVPPPSQHQQEPQTSQVAVYDSQQYEHRPQQHIQNQQVNPVQRTRSVARRFSPQSTSSVNEIQTRSRQVQQYNPEPQAPAEYIEPQMNANTQIAYAPEPDPQTNVQPQYQSENVPRRSSHRRYRTYRNYNENTAPPKQFAPSVFEKIGLGQAPDGVYVPEDSLLNILRPEAHRKPRVQQTEIAAPHQPERMYRSQEPYYPPPQQEVAQVDEYPQQRRVQPPQKPRQTAPTNRRQRARQNRRQTNTQPQSQLVDETPKEIVYNEYSGEVNDGDQLRIRNNAVSNTPRKRQKPQANITPAPQTRQFTTFRPARLAIAALPDDTDGDGIPGEAGIDYPTLHVIPTTSFSCSQQPFNGYYADMETSCQVVHLCQSGGEKDSFLCPNGTIFSQEKFSCQWWYKVNCADAPRYYGINDNLYKIPASSSGRREERK